MSQERMSQGKGEAMRGSTCSPNGPKPPLCTSEDAAGQCLQSSSAFVSPRHQHCPVESFTSSCKPTTLSHIPCSQRRSCRWGCPNFQLTPEALRPTCKGFLFISTGSMNINAMTMEKRKAPRQTPHRTSIKVPMPLS